MFVQPLKVAEMMRPFKCDWFVAGGWAIDLFLERETRPHGDIEIAVWRRDQTALYDYLSGWTLQKTSGGKLSAWHRGEVLEPPIHEIHCFSEQAELQQIEVLLNESNKNEWLYRRNKNIRRSLDKCYSVSGVGEIRYLSPEITLLYKSKNPRDKDEQDFKRVIKHLDVERKTWLKNAIAASTDDGAHSWLKSL
jgi:hypothetical protein